MEQQRTDRVFFERVIGLALVLTLGAACLTVVAPFAIPLLWAIVLAVSTWPAYRRLRDLMGGHRRTAAALMALLLFLVLVGPIAVIIASLADDARALGDLVGEVTRDLQSPEPPPFLAGVPVIGPALDAAWREATANAGATLEQARPYVGRASGWLLARGADLGEAVLEFLVAIVITGILYVTAEPATATLRRLVGRVGSQREVDLLDLAAQTIRGVAAGVIGSAFVQGVFASVGLLIAGAPAPVLLGFATFLTGVIQLPSALVLLPMAAWLGWHGDTWQAVFLVVWALAFVGTIDNVVRPYLISQGADLPFLLIFAGVIGGLLTWGFIGIFLGATLLAVSYKLFQNWLEDDPSRPPQRPRLVVAGTTTTTTTTEETR